MRHQLYTFLFVLFGTLLAGAAVAQDKDLGSGTVGGYRWNEFGPSGGKCMDACGPGCPLLNCGLPEDLKICHPEKANTVVQVARYTCGTHPACSAHDTCLEACQTAQGDDYSGIDFVAGECQQECHRTAGLYAYEETGGSWWKTHEVVRNWIRGFEPKWIPWTSTGTWDYSMDEPDGFEKTKTCKDCQKCEEGVCKWTEEECGTCVSCGDVHAQTLDGLRFNFQVAGELVVLENDDRSFVLQARSEPHGDTVSLNTAAAVRVYDDVVGYYLYPEPRLLINGEDADMQEGETIQLMGGGTVERLDWLYRIRWRDGSLVGLAPSTLAINIYAHLSEDQAGRVSGFAGNRDGNPGNDFATRDGELLASRYDTDLLYGVYADSWRISQDESLFEYAPGENTATYQIRDFPREPINLYDLDPDQLAAAESACLAQDIEDPRLLRDCIYDVAVTGDESFAEVYGGMPAPVSIMPAEYLAGTPSSNVAIAAPGQVSVSSMLDVTYTGDRLPGDFIGISKVGARAQSYLTSALVRGDGPVTIVAPDAIGDYSLRYVRGESVASNLPLKVVPLSATISAPATAISGNTIVVEWQGPGDRLDYVAVTDPDAPIERFHNFRRPIIGQPMYIVLPERAGRYEIRYVHGGTGAILDSQFIEVEKVPATLDAAASVGSGSELEVSWTGPGNHNDLIAIVDPKLDEGERGYRRVAYVQQGNPATITVPDEPGDYELRYVQSQSKVVLATRPFEVTAATATLDAAASIGSGSELEVSWTGPGNHNDLIAIVDPTISEENLRYSRVAYAQQGNPATITVPDEPGDYELRYVQSQSKVVLATRPFEVTAATATLDAAASIGSGSELEVSWTGPGNHNDLIAIVDPTISEENLRYSRVAYAQQGNPAAITVPDEPGDYELRYVQSQSKVVLATRPFEVTAATATLNAAATAVAGGELEVSWTGPGNHNDFIAIVDPSLGEDELRYNRLAYVQQGNPAKIRIPEQPGNYELRYVQAQSKTVLAARQLTVR